MKVLVTINCFGVDASAQGGLDIACMLKRAGNQVLVQTAPGTPVDEAARERGLERAHANLRKSSFISGVLPYGRIIRRFDPHVIITTRAEGQTASVLTAPGRFIVRVRCDIRKPSGGFLRGYVESRTDLAVFPAGFMVSRGYAGAREGRVQVIPQPVDTDAFHYLGERGSNDHVLVSIGRLSPMKGHRTLIRAMTMLPRGVRAIIAGPPSQQTAGELMEYCNELGVGDRVEIAGRVPDVREVISRGTVGVVTSLGSEVVSRAGMEMMAQGLPLLAASTNGLLDLVEDGVTGLLHSPGNSRQLAAQANFLLKNPSLVHRMGRNAHKRIVEKYSFSSVSDEWQRVLESLANGTESVSSGIRNEDVE